MDFQQRVSPFFQLHGRDNLAPWTIEERTDEVISLYRYYASLHHHMVPLLVSLAENAYAGGPMPVQPIGDAPGDWENDWRWIVDDTFLIAPIINGETSRDVVLQAMEDGWRFVRRTRVSRWRRNRRRRDAAVGHPAAFLKEGAIIPMVVDSDATGLGDASSADAWTILVAAAFDDDTGASTFPLFSKEPTLRNK